MTVVCQESEITEAEAKEFTIGELRIMVLRWQGQIIAYLNSCPHAGWPLNLQPDRFFNLEQTLIQCSNHMALFKPDTGECVSGPCVGSTLTRLPVRIENNRVSVSLKT